MPWVEIRSRRDPAVWLPLLAVLAVLVPLAIATHVWLDARAEELVRAAEQDPARAIREALVFARTLGWVLAAASAAIGATLLHYCQRGLREGRLPPAGWWSLGAFRIAVGDTALRNARVGRIVAVGLIVASLGLGLATEHLLGLMERAAAEAREDATPTHDAVEPEPSRSA